MMLNHLAPGNSARLAATIALISLVFAPCSLAEARHRGCDHKRHHDATCTGHEARRRHATGRKKAKPEGSLGQSSASSTTTRQPGVPATSADPLFPPNSVPVTSADPLFPPNSVPVTSADPLFSPSSVWNAPLPADAPFDPNSSAVVANLLHQEVTESLGIATTSYGVPDLHGLRKPAAGPHHARPGTGAGGPAGCLRRGPAARQREAGRRHRREPGRLPAKHQHDVGVLAPVQAG